MLGLSCTALEDQGALHYVMYLSACSCSMRAEYLASWNSESASSKSPLLMPSRPFVLASMNDGVSSCSTAQHTWSYSVTPVRGARDDASQSSFRH